MRIQLTVIGLAAALLLGGCSYFGIGSKKTEKTAAEPTFDVLKEQRAQWQQLANKGDAEAEYQLGMSYCCGYGPGHTDAIARKWLCRAALQGHVEAQFQLGRMYGNEVKKRPLHDASTAQYAYMWYSLAAAQGSELAAGYLSAMENYMSQNQIAEAQKWQHHLNEVVNCAY